MNDKPIFTKCCIGLFEKKYFLWVTSMTSQKNHPVVRGCATNSGCQILSVGPKSNVILTRNMFNEIDYEYKKTIRSVQLCWSDEVFFILVLHRLKVGK